jgi:hypothetical protein
MIKNETMVNVAKTTLAIPLVVPKAMFTLDRSFALTIVCW